MKQIEDIFFVRTVGKGTGFFGGLDRDGDFDGGLPGSTGDKA